MAKQNDKEERPAKERVPAKESWIHPDAKKSIVAIFFIAIAILLLLSSFAKAGPAGDFIFGIFDKLLGWGYYLLPLTLLMSALVFFVTERQKVVASSAIGGALLVLSGLGFIDILSPEKGGLLGSLIGTVQIPFGYAASLVLTGATLVASTIITLNAPIKIKNPFNKKTASEDQEKDKKILTKEEEGRVEAVTDETAPAKNQKGASDGHEETKALTPVAEGGVLSDNEVRKKMTVPRPPRNYVPPPLSLLKSSVEKPTSGDLRANANIIKRTLESFGIPVEMSEINVGPKVTRYTLKPAEGVKLSKIVALNPDLALALAAHPIRIEAPIPGKSLVGIEVPNKAAAIVRLGSLMVYPEFAASGQLGFVLGRDVTGNLILADIAKMPHLLLAGATGSGKSVALHSLIVSLLYKNSPEMLRFVMIDPKRVELSIYNGIPHLITPVVTEGKKAVNVFRWAIGEMERRYGTLESSGNRDIKSYNAAHKEEPIANIVIVIDELADLMAAYGREIESSIVRLAQMARATGIHLVVATQRPSVEVITGLIKANITSRMALQVASQVDSRTILDNAGAEKLLGGGDMLFISAELSKPRRIQGAYISEEEIGAVAEFIRKNNEPEINHVAVSTIEKAVAENGPGTIFDEFENGDDEDNLLGEAIDVIKEAKKASASLLQRRLSVGYARAARLLDIMEAKGIIGPGDGAKPREIYINENDQ